MKTPAELISELKGTLDAAGNHCEAIIDFSELLSALLVDGDADSVTAGIRLVTLQMGDHANSLRDGLGEQGHTPRRSGTERQQRAWQAAEELGFGTCRGERKANAAQRRELGSGQFPGFGNGVAHGQHQPISGRMEHETDLVWRAPNGNWCDRRRAASCAA